MAFNYEKWLKDNSYCQDILHLIYLTLVGGYGLYTLFSTWYWMASNPVVAGRPIAGMLAGVGYFFGAMMV